MPSHDQSRSNAPLSAGTVLSHYRLEERIGEGGMGVVFRATDTHLNRPVAIKLIAPGAGGDGLERERFLREARAACALNHPGVVTIHEVDASDGVDFLVMELVSGQSLSQTIRPPGLAIDDVLTIAEQIAAALECAHTAGIVHRDVKPANVMLTPSGQVKVLDFGLAKPLPRSVSPDADTAAVTAATLPGQVVGSLPYMSPEQAQGVPVDDRSDVFSFGVLLYEMLAARRPFDGTTTVETLAKILESTPPPLDAIRTDAPRPLVAIVRDCLEKDRAKRPSAQAVRRQLHAMREARRAATVSVRAALTRRPVVIAAASVIALALAGAGWWWWSGREEREARRRVPELLALAEAFDFDGFYRLAREVVPRLPNDPQVKQAWLKMTGITSFTSDPPGAEASVKLYASTGEWIPLGRTPIENIRLPVWVQRLKLEKNGYVPQEVWLLPFSQTYRLEPVSSAPQGMVRVPAGPGFVEGVTHPLRDFWVDKFEVTNRQFKGFVDAGGYRRKEYWKEPIADGARVLTWEEAMARFVDRTGRPGPATWELGAYPTGEADFPVGGVSWYEASAFAAFAGKALPTAFEWRAAAALGSNPPPFSDILTVSNFSRKGAAPVGRYAGLAVWGTFDMAGNVKEWCWNEAPGGRMILGGGWNEPTYMFDDRDAQPPAQRLPMYGIRLVKNIEAQPMATYAHVRKATRDLTQEKPVDDVTFSVIRGLYQYEPRPLNARVESTEDEPDWRHEIVTFDAGYAGERIIAHLYLPKTASPPYQVVMGFAGGDASLLKTSRDLRLTEFDFLIRSGRALLYPVYKGTYERQVKVAGAADWRDLVVARGKDIKRAIDYVESRQDLDATRVAFYGLSLGAVHGIFATAVEPRFKASVLAAGGLSRDKQKYPELDGFNYAPRITVPTLMINGKSDFTFPYETAQVPLFRALGTPAEHKRHEVLEGGHLPPDFHGWMRIVLDWFDKYLGPVRSRR